MDRNTITGFALLAVLVIAYFTYNNYSQNKYEQKRLADSIAMAKLHPAPPIDSSKLVAAKDTAIATPLSDSAIASLAPALRPQKAQMVTLENKDLNLQFSTLGAYPVRALLKDYKTYSGKPLVFFEGKGNSFSLNVPTGNAQVATSELNFHANQLAPNKIDFVADLGAGRAISLVYSLPEQGYMMQCELRLKGIAANSLPLRWDIAPLPTERDIHAERIQTQIHFQYKDGKHDYFTVKSEGIHKTPNEMPLHWMGFRAEYFTSALIQDAGFTQPDISAQFNAKDTNIVATQAAAAVLPIKQDGTASLKWYIGPNKYNTLKQFGIGLDEMVPMGVGILAFTRYINKWLIVPVFDLLTGFVGNYGLIIIIMTIFIKLLTSFFTYKSYLSSAKMRVLKPELDELRKKVGGDQQKMGMEQMKLYREAGVNPMGGCLPTLFMMPFLIAMYSFIPSAIEFRQQSFLWAHDLSTYDSIARLPFSWFDHISLFTLLMTASSLFLALYNKNMTPQDPNNPMMKYIPYIFPIVLLGIFNKMAAALTFYYFFSNLVTIAQQYIIQNFIIDEKKIHRQIKEARLKPATPSKWASKIEEIQKAQAARTKQGGPGKGK
ncbi:MAG: membrane protein insertase YidC [Bacteroidetes bacterium]|nr:membrane protein insertase YidC [Bacteroidota bacterium]